MPFDPHDPASLERFRRLTADIRRSGDALDSVFEFLPIGIGVARDTACTHLRANRALAEQLGIDPSQNASLTAPEGERPGFRILIDGVEVPPRELPLQRAAAEGREVGPVECDVVRGDGSRAALMQYTLPLIDEAGAGALLVSVDITERRRVEQEQRFLARASELLASSLDFQATLSALAQLAVPVLGDYCAIDVIQNDGTFKRVEFVIADERKRDVAEALKHYPPRLDVSSPAADALRSGRALLLRGIDRGVRQRATQSAEHGALLDRLDAHTSVLVPLTARGRSLGLLTVGCCDPATACSPRDFDLIVDVGRRAALALDNALLYREAQEVNRLKDDFLATLSHELRTPLNALLGWTQLLKMAPLDESARRRALDSIERNAQAQAVLVNDLLDVSRVISGKLRLEESAVDLPAIVLAAVDAVRPAVRARDIDLRVSLGTLSGELAGDADRLQQIVWNLLSNAVKFTPPGGCVEVAVEQTGGAVQVVVADTGVGIDPAFLPFVFERFRQADSSTTRTQAGLGLGLAIVRHLVDLHGGTVTAESEGRDCGARFTVTLPARHRPAVVPPPDPGGVLSGIRVLAVDDDADSRELLLLSVRSAGAEVMVVGSAAAALDALDSFVPDVLVTDIAMPAFDGYALLREVQARLGTSAPPALALSAYLQERDRQRVVAAGFARYMSKPADYDELVHAIAALAGSRVSRP